MGKTVELFGLIVFQVFFGLILTATYLTKKATTVVRELTQGSVEAFVREFSDITSAGNVSADTFQRTNFLMSHLQDEGLFKNVVRYKSDWGNPNEKVMSVGKSDYIQNLLQNKGKIQEYEFLVKIDNITIDSSRRKATVFTTNYERGTIPMQDETGETFAKPLSSTAYCEQTIILNDKNIMQISSSTCTTDLALAE